MLVVITPKCASKLLGPSPETENVSMVANKLLEVATEKRALARVLQRGRLHFLLIDALMSTQLTSCGAGSGSAAVAVSCTPTYNASRELAGTAHSCPNSRLVGAS